MAVHRYLFVITGAYLFSLASPTTLNISNPVSTCTYTFNVPRDGETCLPGSQQGNVDALETLITNQHALLEQQLHVITEKLVHLEEADIIGNHDNEDDNVSTAGGGTTYTHWGRTSCPETATEVYQGYVGKSYYTYGGGVNYLCLPDEPEFPDGASIGYQSQSYIYGIEYGHLNSPVFDSSHIDNDVPCAVCDVDGRNRLLMIPAKMSCPTGWVKEYQGLLMSQHHTQKSAEFLCVSDEMEHLAGGSANQEGGLLYVVEARCGALKCPPYIEGYEIACVVCTK